MGRYIGPVCRLCRREGVKLYLKGYKCSSPKCPLTVVKKKPGNPPKKISASLSEFGIRFREKQKIKRLYCISERQLRRFLEVARRMQGIIVDNLVSLLERRLDNVIYRSGFARSRREARQMVLHKHVKVNDRYVNIASFIVKPNDKIEFLLKNSDIESNAKDSYQKVPQWISVDLEKNVINILRKPEGADLVLDAPLNVLYIVEYYSK